MGDGDDFLHVRGTRTNWLVGNDGDDTLRSDNGDSFIFGGDGDDEIHGSRDHLNETDWLSGGAGNDTIYTHGGEATISGGTGDDVLISRHGALNDEDTFVFELHNNDDFGIDIIRNFSTIDDVIILSHGDGPIVPVNFTSAIVGNDVVISVEGNSGLIIIEDVASSWTDDLVGFYF